MNPALAPADAEAASRIGGQMLRISVGRVILGWAFGAIFFQLSAGAVYASFARQLDASDATFGFLAGIYPLMGFVQIIAARILEVEYRPRAMMLYAGLTSRVLWVIAAALPLLHHFAPVLMRREWMLPTFVGCLLVSSVGQAFTGPAFFSWMSAIVPERVGASFWARRHQVGTIVAIFAVLIGGSIADHAGAIKDWSNGVITPLLTYSILLTFAACCGVMDIAAFIGVKEPPRVERTAMLPPLWESLKEPLRERAVHNYLAFTAIGMVGFATTGPMLWLYCLEFLEYDKTETGFLITICPLLGMALTARWWGGIAKIHGTRPMVRFASAGMVLVPICWLLALPESKPGLALMLFCSGILMTAYEISNLNFLTRTAPRLPRPTVTALFAICAGTTFALTAWLAGIAADYFSAWHFDFAGIRFVNYHLILAFSILPRTVNAVFMAPRLEENDATGTRETVNEVGASLANAIAPRFTRFFEAREE